MAIDEKLVEIMCFDMKNKFSGYFDWKEIDIEYARIDIKNEKINILTNNYGWIVILCENDLGLIFKDRLAPGIKCWSDYSELHKKTMNKLYRDKIDICIKYGEIYEIFSIGYMNKLPIGSIMTLYTCRPIIADYAFLIWNKNKKATFNFKKNSHIEFDFPQKNNMTMSDLLNIHGYMRFGDVRLTRKEIITIKLLLSQYKLKEISAYHGCSLFSEQKRIQRIKEKLDCSFTSASGLFHILKAKGITSAYLDDLID
ncbi:hypothetical protein [Providencia stuartii]|uniref:hypothetical protein n=1 Tax=Providencia stuartii TaxID=588 RepID=UPI00300D74AB